MMSPLMIFGWRRVRTIIRSSISNAIPPPDWQFWDKPPGVSLHKSAPPISPSVYAGNHRGNGWQGAWGLAAPSAILGEPSAALDGQCLDGRLCRLAGLFAIGENRYSRHRCGQIEGAATRILRTSFTGELGFEINVPSGQVVALWQKLIDVGTKMNITPFGIEALMVMRTEKGYIHVGADTDSSTIPADIGFGRVAQNKQANFICKRSLYRPQELRTDREVLVGLQSANQPKLCPFARSTQRRSACMFKISSPRIIIQEQPQSGILRLQRSRPNRGKPCPIYCRKPAL
ncbi:Sarcosine oxidase alpha subunit [hydrothermal vent metagenome]|uniref:Sarcosine oxidase alpha subunit n=1 Tax=hydrothermal vent metagenome TaxID=652676 RepID=A0A3B0RSW2_9ZZZZ